MDPQGDRAYIALFTVRKFPSFHIYRLGEYSDSRILKI